MIYADYLSTAEMQRWNLDTDIAWDEVNAELALSQPEILQRVRASALIESFFPIFTPRDGSAWDDVAATAVFGIQLPSRISTSRLQPILHRVEYDPIDDEEIAAIAGGASSFGADRTRLLTHYMMSSTLPHFIS
jgi:hypothetical protein